MKSFIFILTTLLSYTALAESCSVTFLEGRKLVKELEASKLVWNYQHEAGTRGYKELNCSEYRLFKTDSGRGLEGYCSDKWIQLELETLYSSTDGNFLFKSVNTPACSKNSSPNRIVRFQVESFVQAALIEKKNRERLEAERAARTCTLKDGFSTTCYTKRDEAKLKVALLHYGSFWSEEDLERFKKVLKKRFEIATSNELKLEIVFTSVIPLRHQVPFDYKVKGISDIKRLQRIWYYDNVGTKLGYEIHEEFVSNHSENELLSVDFIVATTEAQYEALGFQSGNIIVVEQPREVAWDNNGWSQTVNDYELSDVLIHEIGHAVGIGHASEQCSHPKTPLTPGQAATCCADSPSKNDVMSYCRDRASNSETKIGKFEKCTLDLIKDHVKPRLLGGLDKMIPENHCR